MIEVWKEEYVFHLCTVKLDRCAANQLLDDMKNVLYFWCLVNHLNHCLPSFYTHRWPKALNFAALLLQAISVKKNAR